MATLPKYTFPLRHTAPPQPDGSTPDAEKEKANTERPQILLQTPLRRGERQGYSFSVPEVPHSQRPCSTPPESPVRARAYTCINSPTEERISFDAKIMARKDSATMTPPSTPTRTKRAPSDSTTSRPRASSNDLATFPYWITDYKVTTDAKGTKKILGSGVWSDVYHATPTLPTSPPPASISIPDMSPPVTPHSRTSSTASTTSSTLPYLPSAYAIKNPSSAAAQKVLTEEARILSYLTRFPGAEKYIVPFHGQDPRSGALVMKLMDSTLEDWTNNTLNALPEPARAAKLAEVFPHMAQQLIDGLIWLKSKGCIHADIKPANILVSTAPGSTIPTVLFTDFSSSFLTAPASLSASPAPASTTRGGGTWDYLEPHMLASATSNATPTPRSDLWATAITLLTVIIGCSPFDFVGRNLFQRRERIKQGTPVEFVGYGDDGARNAGRLRVLSTALDVKMGKWFREVFGSQGVSVEAWREGLVKEGGARI